MQIAEALAIIQNISVDYDSDLLATLTYMRDHLEDFTNQEARAYRIVFAGFAEMFAPV